MPYHTNKGEHTALYKSNKNISGKCDTALKQYCVLDGGFRVFFPSFIIPQYDAKSHLKLLTGQRLPISIIQTLLLLEAFSSECVTKMRLTFCMFP